MGTKTVIMESQQSMYFIDPTFIEASGRSSSLLARERRCQQCRSDLKKTKGPDNTSFVGHRKIIAKCCSKKDTYLRPDMPLMEAIFRILLSGPTKGISHPGLFKILRDKWANQKVPKNLSDVLVYQIVAISGSYGVQTFHSEKPAKA